MIILIGLPKSGTTSFHQLFKSLGYLSLHWNYKCSKTGEKKYIGRIMKSNKQQNRPLLDFIPKDLSSKVVMSQMDYCMDDFSYWPQIYDYETLYKENPDAVFILNKRDPEKIFESFEKWLDFLDRIFRLSPDLFNLSPDEYVEDNDQRRKLFVEMVNRHYKNIEGYFADKVDARFISFDIEKDGLDKLAKFIDLKEVKELPKANSNPGKVNWDELHIRLIKEKHYENYAVL